MPIERIIRPVPELAEMFAGLVEDAHREARLEGRAVSVALPGGSVAESFLPRLQTLTLDWDRVLVFFGDERAVAPESALANAGLARSLWLDRVPVPLGNIHRIRAESADLEAAARDYDRLMRTVLGDPPRLDIALLGMGGDGHVCSLFPGHEALDETERYVVPVVDAPKPPPRRITLTLPALAAARTVVLAAFGPGKAAAAKAALDDRRSPLPAARALRGAPRAFALLDPEAASGLAGLTPV